MNDIQCKDHSCDFECDEECTLQDVIIEPDPVLLYPICRSYRHHGLPNGGD